MKMIFVDGCDPVPTKVCEKWFEESYCSVNGII
jgi:hypothetical protein